MNKTEAPTNAHSVPLTQLRRGQQAVLADIALSDQQAESLRAMGLKPECELTLCRSGEPCIVSVVSGSGRCRIGLARKLADGVLVSPETR